MEIAESWNRRLLPRQLSAKTLEAGHRFGGDGVVALSHLPFGSAKPFEPTGQESVASSDLQNLNMARAHWFRVPWQVDFEKLYPGTTS